MRFIDAFVEGLEMEELGFEGTAPKEMGRRPYDPRDLLKLYIYGYLNGVRTGRRLAGMSEKRGTDVVDALAGPDLRRLPIFAKTIAKRFGECLGSLSCYVKGWG